TRLLSADGGFTVVLGRNSLVPSRNAPYGGWEGVMAEGRPDRGGSGGVVDLREVSRSGLRYINRIDIPFDPSGLIPLEQFFSFRVHAPVIAGFSGMTNFAVNVEMAKNDPPVKLVIN